MSPTYAVMGATGNCGNSLIQVLLNSPDAKVNAYCRNKAKLYRMLPRMVDDKRVRVFEGDITDLGLFTTCLRGCQAVFLVVTMNDNLPGCRVAEDTAITVIAALKKIREETMPHPKMPKIVVLSSATIDKHLSRNMPWWFHPIMIRAGSFDWVSTIFIKPGGLAIDKSRGHRLDFDQEDSFIAYFDLAAAMIEAADDVAGLYDMRNVSVVNTNGSAAFPWGTPMCIVYGLLRHYFPWMHPYLPSAGP
ncbi:MAG: hypothetical protein M1820_010197 [Bogoriella megaspora]|nr:MAG: hypothetical protein M1820_010197 [Bogoriella megaspora]